MHFKFCTETQKNARRKLLNLRNKDSVFVPNYFYPGKKFDRGRFWSRARQPLLSRERASRNQENNTKNFHFCQASSKHLITLEPKAYLFFSKLLSFSDLFASVAPVLSRERNSNGVTENINNCEQESVKFGENVAFLCDLAHSFMTNAKHDKIRCLF